MIIGRVCGPPTVAAVPPMKNCSRTHTIATPRRPADMEQEHTDDEFARLIKFYDDIKRSKLNDADLSKVVSSFLSSSLAVEVYKKYSRNKTQLVEDI